MLKFYIIWLNRVGGGGYSISDNLKMTDVMYIFVHLFLWQNKVEILDKCFVLFLLNAVCLAELLQIPIIYIL